MAKNYFLKPFTFLETAGLVGAVFSLAQAPKLIATATRVRREMVFIVGIMLDARRGIGGLSTGMTV
jgi:hypothetical protein